MGGMGRDFDGGDAEYTVLPKNIVIPFESDLGWDGLTVIATTRNLAKEERLRDNGASYTLIDDGSLAGKVKDLFPDGADKVLELVGLTTLKDSLQCVKPGGTLCLTGSLSEEWTIKDFSPMGFIPSMVKLTTYVSDSNNVSREILQNFIDTVKAGQIELNVDRVFYLADIAKAHEYMENNEAAGKIVVLT